MQYDREAIKEFQKHFPNILNLEILFVLSQTPSDGYRINYRIENIFGLHISGGTIYPTLEKLERAGYIYRKADVRNARKRKICYLTEKSRFLLKNFYRAFEQRNNHSNKRRID